MNDNQLRQAFEQVHPVPRGVKWDGEPGIWPYHCIDMNPGLEMQISVGRYNSKWDGWQSAREREAKAVKDTIERCAKICDAKADGIIEESWDDGYNKGAAECAGAIRTLAREIAT